MRMRIYAYKLRMRWTLISERYCNDNHSESNFSLAVNMRQMMGIFFTVSLNFNMQFNVQRCEQVDMKTHPCCFVFAIQI